MERETKKINTPQDNIEVVLKAWITGGERRKISSVLLEGSSIKSIDLQDINISPEVVNKMQDVTFEEVIVSIDGSKEDIVKRILEMKAKDFDFIVEEINKVTESENEVKKN